MDDRMRHFAAHPYYLMGASAERDRILQLLKDNQEWNNIQDAIDGLESGA